MRRSGKILVLSHCLLNANSKIKGSAQYGTVYQPVIAHIMERDIGMLQLPCPEHSFSGCARWGQSKDQYDNPFYRSHCRKILKPVVEQLSDYAERGYMLAGILGIKGSPSCGIEHTYRAQWGGEIGANYGSLPEGRLVTEPGVFMEIFRQMITEAALELKFFEVEEEDPEKTLYLLRKFLA